MRKLFILALSVIAIVTSSNAGLRKYGTIENPVIESTNASTIDIKSISTSNKSTVVNFHARFRPHWWIRIAPDAYLEADGKKYEIIGAEDITLGKELYMPDSGECDFTITFAPLPRDVNKVDFIEGNSSGDFRIYGIDLTGHADPAAVNQGIPTALTGKVKMPRVGPVMAVDSAVINIHIPDFGKWGDSELSLQKENALYVDGNGTSELELDSLGNARISTLLYGPASYLLVSNGVGYPIIVAPGENIDVYLDVNASGRSKMSRRDRDAKEHPLLYIPNTYQTGQYADLAKALQSLHFPEGLIKDTDSVDYNISADKWIDLIIGNFRAGKDIIDKSELDAETKHLLTLTIENILLRQALDTQHELRTAYRVQNNYWERDFPEGIVQAEITPELQKRVLAEICDINDPMRVMLLPKGYWEQVLYTDNQDMLVDLLPANSFMSDVLKFKKGMASIHCNSDNNPINSLENLENQFYADAAKRRIKEIEDFEKSLDTNLMSTIPDVPADEFFDTILAPYKGKVVMVDLWNTWCAPCRAAIRENEPLKTGEFAGTDVVWMYIANETSPLPTYLSSITKINGVHYRVTPEIWKAIDERFHIDGIPFYILVDKDGTATARPDLRDHSKYVDAIKNALK